MPTDTSVASAKPLKGAHRFVRICVYLPFAAQNTSVRIAQKTSNVAKRITQKDADLMWKFAAHTIF